MPINTSRTDAVHMRRELVGQFRAKGMTTREIVKALASLKDPINVSHVTVSTDIKAVVKIWQANAQVAISEHIERELAELAEAKREARQQNNLDTWARLLALEMKLLGTDAPQKIEDWTGRNWRDAAQREGHDANELFAAMVEAARARIAARVGVGASGGGSVADGAGGDSAADEADRGTMDAATGAADPGLRE